jgi:hypothetical protein
MDIANYPFYQKLLELGLVRVQRTDGTFWWVGPICAEEQVRLGEAQLALLTMEQARERDESGESPGMRQS